MTAEHKTTPNEPTTTRQDLIIQLYQCNAKKLDELDEILTIVDQNQERFQNLQGPDVEIDRGFVELFFYDPLIVAQSQAAVLATLKSAMQFIKEESSDLEESFFFIRHQYGEGINTSRGGRKSADYRIPIPIPDSKAKDTPDVQTLALVHTHPPISNVLRPSVIREHEGEYLGDLYSFVRMRREQSKTPDEPERPAFTEYPVLVIIQQDIKRNSTKFLFIRTTAALSQLEEDNYVTLLKKHAEGINNAETEQDVCAILKRIGFRTAYVEIPDIDTFWDYPFAGSDAIDVVSRGITE